MHDDTQALQSAIDHAAGAPIQLVAKTYKVEGPPGGILKIPASGIRLQGAGPQKSVIRSATGSSYILVGVGAKGMQISNVGFEGTDGQTVGIVASGACSGIRISDCAATGCALYYGNTGGSYRDANPTNSPRDVQILNSTGRGNPKSIVGRSFIDLYYNSDVVVSSCRADHYVHGITWWGGDSAANADGAPSAQRKAQNISIANCSMSNMGAGGIWGSMGRNIKVTNCRVDTCGDVGLDAEGSQDVIFSNCKVRNCTNGCLTTFWGVRNILFENIDVEMSGPYGLAFRSYNATLDATFADGVRIVGGSMVHLDGTGQIDQGNGPLDNFLMQGTRLKDVIINLAQPKIHNVTIDGVSVELTRPAPNGMASAAVVVGNLEQDGRSAAKAIVQNCTITTTIPQPGIGDRAIAFVGGDVNAVTYFAAQQNTTRGFSTDLILNDHAGSSTYVVRGNRFSRGVIDKTGLSGVSKLSVQ